MPPFEGERCDIEAILRKANALLDEWRTLESYVPSADERLYLIAAPPQAEVTIQAHQWRSIVALATNPTGEEFAAALDVGELGLARAVYELVQLGLVEIMAPPLRAENLRIGTPLAS